MNLYRLALALGETVNWLANRECGDNDPCRQVSHSACHPQAANQTWRWTMAWLRTLKMNDRNIHIKMYEGEWQSIYEIYRMDLEECVCYTKVVPWQAMTHIGHTLIRTLLPAHLSFLSIYRVAPPTPGSPAHSTQNSLTTIPIIICDECNFMCFHSMLLCAKTPQAHTPHTHNETQSREHKCAQKTNTRSKRTNIDIFNINFY